MRANKEEEQMEMEARDFNYILPAYTRAYLFLNQNIMPKRIIFPMFPSVKVGDQTIPIEYVPFIDPRVTEIVEDGADVPEVTPAQEAALDEKDDRIKELKAEIATLEKDTQVADLTPAPEDILRQEQEAEGQHEDPDGKFLDAPEQSKAKAAFAEESTEASSAFTIDPDLTHKPPPDRTPNQPPGGDIGPGQGLSDMQARSRDDLVRTKRDLLEAKEDANEDEEKEYEKKVTRGEDGKPVVEE